MDRKQKYSMQKWPQLKKKNVKNNPTKNPFHLAVEKKNT